MTKNKKQFKREIILLLVVVIIALVIYLINIFSTKKANSRVQIYIDGVLNNTVDIEEGKTYDVIQGNYKNTLLFTKNGVKVVYSNCDNQLCVHQGEVNADNYKTRVMGNSIICLPHNLAIRLELEDESTDDNTIDN